MRIDTIQINMYDLIICLSNAGDLISTEVADHHQKVAYLAFRIAEQMNLPIEDRKVLVLAGLLHDMGAFSLDERLDLIENEPLTANDHAFRGARLLESFPPLAVPASVIRHHHVSWDYGQGRTFYGREVSPLSHILHLADRIAVSIKNNKNVIDQIPHICDMIMAEKGSRFNPDMVDAFMAISSNEYIWLDVVYQPLRYILPDIALFDTYELTMNDLIALSQIFASIIDFRNPFTAYHSAGVASTAEKIAELAGFSTYERKMMLIAGNLHDLGKLAVSRDILNKPGQLNEEERNIMRSHTFYTFRLLQPLKGFETINRWASFHHEKLNGKGYPFHLSGDSLPLGSRIMAVADIFTAISEDRPYRKGMSMDRVISIINSMVADGSICPYVVSILMDNLDEVDTVRREKQREKKLIYDYVMSAPQ